MPEDISLLPQEIEKLRAQEEHERSFRNLSLIFAAVSLLICLSVVFYAVLLQNRLAGLEDDTTKEIVRINSLSDVYAKMADLEKRYVVLSQTLEKSPRFSVLLSAVSAAVPSDITLTEMTAPSEKAVTIAGSARSYVSLAKFLIALKESVYKKGLFEMIELRTVSLDKQSGQVRFDVSVNLLDGGLR